MQKISDLYAGASKQVVWAAFFRRGNLAFSCFSVKNRKKASPRVIFRSNPLVIHVFFALAQKVAFSMIFSDFLEIGHWRGRPGARRFYRQIEVPVGIRKFRVNFVKKMENSVEISDFVFSSIFVGLEQGFGPGGAQDAFFIFNGKVRNLAKIPKIS